MWFVDQIISYDIEPRTSYHMINVKMLPQKSKVELLWDNYYRSLDLYIFCGLLNYYCKSTGEEIFYITRKKLGECLGYFNSNYSFASYNSKAYENNIKRINKSLEDYSSDTFQSTLKEFLVTYKDNYSYRIDMGILDRLAQDGFIEYYEYREGGFVDESTMPYGARLKDIKKDDDGYYVEIIDNQIVNQIVSDDLKTDTKNSVISGASRSVQQDTVPQDQSQSFVPEKIRIQYEIRKLSQDEVTDYIHYQSEVLDEMGIDSLKKLYTSYFKRIPEFNQRLFEKSKFSGLLFSYKGYAIHFVNKKITQEKEHQVENIKQLFTGVKLNEALEQNNEDIQNHTVELKKRRQSKELPEKKNRAGFGYSEEDKEELKSKQSKEIALYEQIVKDLVSIDANSIIPKDSDFDNIGKSGLWKKIFDDSAQKALDARK